MKIKNNLVLALSLLILSFSCSSDDDHIQPESLGNYENGILITHEGSFTSGFGTISYVSNDFSTVENHIFSNVNGRTLGAVAQSMAFNGDLAYIVINVSNQIEVVNRYTFESVARIDSGLSNPRYMTISNGKGYVTNWGDFTPSDDDYVAVVDLSTNKVINKISSSYLPEEIVAKDDKVYVATGIFDKGDKVDVINSTTDELELSITVGNSPNSLQFDSNGNLWALSSENLIKIDRSTNTVLQTIDFGEEIDSPSNLNFDSGNFYMYAGGSVYKMDESSTTFPTTPEFSNANFYGMNVRNGILYGVDAGDFSSSGSLKVYDLSSNTETESITLSLIPGGIYFND